ncbi:MAG TPA: EcsC family protein, partial [Candidatus Acidoferrum sp.]|nr:EcsC family protein [Candidatus Acidoferrum sp.]
LGLGGVAAALPDFGILAAVTVRMLQKLSLTYGFNYSTDEELFSLWLAAATAAGLDLGRDFLEKQAIEKLVPRIVDAVALRAGAEVAETLGSRVIPIFSAGAAGALNYWFVNSWGRRAQRHFLERRRTVRILPGQAGPHMLGSPMPG